ncbi:hypothetical protein [Streptomyces apocyni]|uniref:hypothetical protein n=1 Tax=Streptomyces apocyni TaxID=2654677 RepID=UPI0012E9D67B|nr:hypothetical protein [Streptomyces apocyni]
MHPENPGHAPDERAVTVHQPTPVTPLLAAPLVPVQATTVPAVASIVLSDGRIVTGYAIEPAKPEPVAVKPPVSRAAVNIALGGIGFGALCGGLFLLTAFIAALTALITQLIILAAVLFGGYIALQILGTSSHSRGGSRTTVNIRKAVFKHNHFHG